jgi:hypothetical protein
LISASVVDAVCISAQVESDAMLKSEPCIVKGFIGEARVGIARKAKKAKKAYSINIDKDSLETRFVMR